MYRLSRSQLDPSEADADVDVRLGEGLIAALEVGVAVGSGVEGGGVCVGTNV